jgi:hypothetical protein
VVFVAGAGAGQLEDVVGLALLAIPEASRPCAVVAGRPGRLDHERAGVTNPVLVIAVPVRAIIPAL